MNNAKSFICSFVMAGVAAILFAAFKAKVENPHLVFLMYWFMLWKLFEGDKKEK